MIDIGNASNTEIFGLLGAIQRKLAKCSCVEAAAQSCIDLCYERFSEDLALARTYVTSSYGSLPAANQRFVDKLVSGSGVSPQPQTPVLSLVATRGNKPAWNDRRQSAGHVSIPLLSTDFVGALPMIARLLTDLGVKLDWIERPERGITTTRTGWSGLFHVIDARTDRDQYQRHIIPAQDFVAENGVRTVFGVGGSYNTGTLFAMIFFTRRTLTREAAQRYLPLNVMFKAATAPHVEAGRIFQA